jgi:hypothetical protein
LVWEILEGLKLAEMTRSEFLKEKAKLREYFKRLKVGMITWEEVPKEYQILLMKYYGIDGK